MPSRRVLGDGFMSPLTTAIDLMSIWRLGIYFGMSALIFLGLEIYTGAKISRLIKATYQESPWIFWAWILLGAVYQLEFPGLPFLDNNAAYSWAAGQTFAEALLIPLSVLLLPKKWRSKCAEILVVLTVIVELFLTSWNSWIIWRHPELANIGYPVINGLMRGVSLDMVLLALLVPFTPWWLALLSILSIVTHHGTTALMVLGAEVFAWAFINLRLRYAIALPVVVTPILGALAYWHSNAPLLDGHERLAAWTRYFSFWWESWGFVAFGVGPGSFMFTAMQIDKKPPIWFFMHSDFLQVPWELGVVGLALMLMAFARLVISARYDVKLLAAMFGLMAASLTYHPFRFFPGMLYAAFVFVAIYEKEKTRRSFDYRAAKR